MTYDAVHARVTPGASEAVAGQVAVVLSSATVNGPARVTLPLLRAV